MKNIEEISKNYLCTNCGACIAACSQNAIKMEYTNIGRLHSVVNSKCIDCGICQKVCPSYNYQKLKNRFSDPYNGTVLGAYITHSSLKNIFSNAQSGGICTTTLICLFENKMIDAAIVCIQKKSNHPRPQAILVENKEELIQSQKSNYTPVDILSALKHTTTKKSVAIVGLPCHIKGATLLNENIKKYSNITYRLGLICDRTLCDGITSVINSYIKDDKFKIVWRQKYLQNEQRFNYRNAPIVIHSTINKQRIFPNTYRFELKDMFTAPHCRICYDKVNVFSDIVFGDPWELENVDWIKGDSLVLTRTEKGEKLFSLLKNDGYAAYVRKPNLEKALNGQFIYEKEEQHPLYINAFRNVFKSTFINQIFSEIDVIENDFVKNAMNEFETFKKNEDLNEKQITKLARNIIYKKKISILKGKLKSIIKKNYLKLQI